MRPTNTIIIPEVQRELWIYLKDRRGFELTAYRCYIKELINLSEEDGYILYRSYYTEKVPGNIYCEDINDKLIHLNKSITIYRK